MKFNKNIIAILVVTIIVITFIGFTIYRNSNEYIQNGWQESIVEGEGKEKISQIFIDGPIYSNSLQHQNSILNLLNIIAEDSSIKGVVLSVNTPGGDVVAIDNIYNELVKIKEKGKKLVVSMNSMATSGGYYIATPADHIYANHSTITGSIGVIMNFTKYDELADKIGYSQVNIKSGEHKDMASPLKEVTPEEKEIYQSVVDDSYEKFLEVIVNGRDMDRERVQNLADGRIYSGYEAKELGLIDKLGSLEDATDYIKKSLNQPNLKVVRVTPKNSIMDSFSPNIQSNLIKDIENIIGINNQARLMYIFDQ